MSPQFFSLEMWNIFSISSTPTCFLRSFIIRSRHQRRHGSNLNFGHLHNSLPFPTNPINYSICKLNMPIYCTDDAVGAVPPLPPQRSWVAWMLMYAFLSIWKTRTYWGPLININGVTVYKVLMGKTEVEVSDMVETVKKTAERVDKLAEGIAEHLPQGSKLHKTALFVEDAAERIAKGAYLARDIIDKIERGEDKLGLLKQNGESKKIGQNYDKAVDKGSKGAIS